MRGPCRYAIANSWSEKGVLFYGIIENAYRCTTVPGRLPRLKCAWSFSASRKRSVVGYLRSIFNRRLESESTNVFFVPSLHALLPRAQEL